MPLKKAVFQCPTRRSVCRVMGFQANSYVFTKALAEQLLEDAAADLPVIITRPSIGV